MTTYPLNCKSKLLHSGLSSCKSLLGDPIFFSSPPLLRRLASVLASMASVLRTSCMASVWRTAAGSRSGVWRQAQGLATSASESFLLSYTRCSCTLTRSTSYYMYKAARCHGSPSFLLTRLRSSFWTCFPLSFPPTPPPSEDSTGGLLSKEWAGSYGHSIRTDTEDEDTPCSTSTCVPWRAATVSSLSGA